MDYVIHVCKNSHLSEDDENYCERVWIDKDKTNVMNYPPSWKYCPECVRKGFKNPRTRNSTQTPEQIEAFKKRMAIYREQHKQGKQGNENK